MEELQKGECKKHEPKNSNALEVECIGGTLFIPV